MVNTKMNLTLIENLLRRSFLYSEEDIGFMLDSIKQAIDALKETPSSKRVNSSQRRLLRPEGEFLPKEEPLSPKAEEPKPLPRPRIHELIYGIRITTIVPLLYHLIDGDVIGSSRKGVLFRIQTSSIGSVDKWFPKSQLVFSTTTQQYFSPRWLMERNNLIQGGI